MASKHKDKFTFLLDINNVPSLYFPAIHLCILHAFITQAIRHKNPRLMYMFSMAQYLLHHLSALKCLIRGLKSREWTSRHQVAGVDIAGVDNAGVDIAGVIGSRKLSCSL